ncbi:MAG: GGDEF domain-containing protein [Hyphomonadaceae bacterium]
MQADFIYQLLNPLVFTVFALGFFAIQKIRSDSSAKLIGISYLVGAAVFIADTIFIHSDNFAIRMLIAAAYASTSVLAVSGVNIYYRKSAPWRTLMTMFVIHLALYGTLLILKMDWIRSLTVNFGVGLIFMVGLIQIRKNLRDGLDKLLFVVGLVNCAHCFIRPVVIAILAGGTLDSSTHDEVLFVISLQLFMAISAIATAMSMFLVLGRDVLEEVQDRSDTDPLTGLLNRRGLEKKAEAVLAKAKHGPVSVIIADIDHFKAVNDTYGHSTGDDIIQLIGSVMREGVPDGAFTVRLGGEEFLAFLPNTDLVEAREIGEKLRQLFEAATLDVGSDTVGCTASFGIAQAQPEEGLTALTIRADRALYLAKNSGRNCIKCETDMGISKLRHLHLELRRHVETVGKRPKTSTGNSESSVG